jgi:carbamoyl-phosphate synthase large subunit
MKSTGEVMGIDKSFPLAFAKAQIGAGSHLPTSGAVFISVRDRDKAAVVDVARSLVDLGLKVIATRGTARLLKEHGIAVTEVNKVLEGRPHCVDAMMSGQVQMVINTTEGTQAISDSFDIRRTALMRSIPHYTTMAGARAAAAAIKVLKLGPLDVAPLQSYFKGSF